MTSKSGLYDARFYSGQKSGSYRSARVIVPLLRALVPVKSVCDVGCGVGGWLRAFQELARPMSRGWTAPMSTARSS